MPNRIPLDAVLPKNFDCTPNEKRSKAQLDAWWDHPYGVTEHDKKIVAEFSSRDEMNLFSLKQEERDRVEVSPTLDHNRMNLAQLA